jgi:hypothetical protein
MAAPRGIDGPGRCGAGRRGVLNAVWGWWWADPLAALAIVPVAIREGLEGWHGADETA